jgi:co-chaperonin GroES (HSP10)
MSTIASGHRIGHETSTTFVQHTQTIRPLRDQIVVEPLPVSEGTHLAVVYQGRAVRGRVLAVGPGHYPKKYDGPKGKRTKSWDSKAFLPTDIKVGDIVHFGDLARGGDLHLTVRWGDKTVVVIREADVTGIEQ